jgi:hypothetical protein
MSSPFLDVEGLENLEKSRRPGNQAQSRVVVAAAVAMVALVLICVASIGTVIWAVVTENLPATSSAVQCSAIGDEAKRLNCFDRLTDRTPTQPAKGALAPSLTGTVER